MSDATVNQLDDLLEQLPFPQGFLDAYDPLECLAHSHGTETFLVQEKGGTKKHIAKCYDCGVYPAVHESAILKSLSMEGLPAFRDEYRNDSAVCVVREYIEGAPLDQYMAGRCLPPAQAVALCAKLCDLLSYLHTRNPPVIHRDIKPQNVIIRENGGVALRGFLSA